MKLDKIKFAQVLSYIGRQFAISMTDSEMRMLDELIDIEAPATPHASINDVDELLRQLNAPDGFIPAIKAYRVLTGAGLKESKEAIELYRSVPKFPKKEATLGDILDNVNRDYGPVNFDKFEG